MGKRSNFERRPRDYYSTPEEAILPLLPLIMARVGQAKISFVEPCAGDGRLVRHLTKRGLDCVYACDIEPQAEGIERRDVLFFDAKPFPKCDYIITNPPWGRDSLFPMIDLFRRQAPTWLLIDAGFMHNGNSKPYLRNCKSIVSVGRVSWMDNGTSSMDDCVWLEFVNYETNTQFIH